MMATAFEFISFQAAHPNYPELVQSICEKNSDSLDQAQDGRYRRESWRFVDDGIPSATHA
jgi:hypothetical protein